MSKESDGVEKKFRETVNEMSLITNYVMSGQISNLKHIKNDQYYGFFNVGMINEFLQKINHDKQFIMESHKDAIDTPLFGQSKVHLAATYEPALLPQMLYRTGDDFIHKQLSKEEDKRTPLQVLAKNADKKPENVNHIYDLISMVRPESRVDLLKQTKTVGAFKETILETLYRKNPDAIGRISDIYNLIPEERRRELKISKTLKAEIAKLSPDRAEERGGVAESKASTRLLDDDAFGAIDIGRIKTPEPFEKRCAAMVSRAKTLYYEQVMAANDYEMERQRQIKESENRKNETDLMTMEDKRASLMREDDPQFFLSNLKKLIAKDNPYAVGIWIRQYPKHAKQLKTGSFESDGESVNLLEYLRSKASEYPLVVDRCVAQLSETYTPEERHLNEYIKIPIDKKKLNEQAARTFIGLISSVDNLSPDKIPLHVNANNHLFKFYKESMEATGAAKGNLEYVDFDGKKHVLQGFARNFEVEARWGDLNEAITKRVKPFGMKDLSEYFESDTPDPRLHDPEAIAIAAGTQVYVGRKPADVVEAMSPSQTAGAAAGAGIGGVSVAAAGMGARDALEASSPRSGSYVERAKSSRSVSSDGSSLGRG